MDRVPDSAACNESVELDKKYGHFASVKYVNGVLRNISRNRLNVKYPDRDGNFDSYLSIKYSHPEWLVRKWLNRFGNEFTEELLKSNNEIPDLTIRVNTLKVKRDKLRQCLVRSRN